MSVVCSTWDCSNCDQKGILNNLCICSNCGMSRNNWECIKCNKTISRCQECIDCGYVKEDTFKFVNGHVARSPNFIIDIFLNSGI